MSNRHAKPNEDDYVVPPSIDPNGNIEMDEVYFPFMIHAYKTYNRLIELGVPIEDARYVLPPAFFTHISFTCNLRSAIHFLELRLAKGSQWEIKELAIKMYDIIYDIYPVCLEHLKDKRDKCYERLHKNGND
jgi:thymidylate synthase (FAD)